MNSYEKMLSGAYLGGLATEVIRYAICDKLLTEAFSESFRGSIILKSKDIDDFLCYPPKDEYLKDLIKNASNKDLAFIYYIFESLVERAAILTSIILASVIVKSDKGKNPCYPVCITPEGSCFYGSKNFQSRVDHYLGNILIQRGNYHYEINKVDNAIILGAAVAGLTG